MVRLHFFLLLGLLWYCSPPSSTHPEDLRMDVQSLIEAADELQHVNYDTALTIAKMAHEIAEEYGNTKGMARSSLLMGQLFYQVGGLDQASKHLSDALRRFASLNELDGRAEASNLLANVYMRSENYEQAAAYLRQALRQFEQLKSAKGLAEVYGSLGHLHEKRQSYDSALWYQSRALGYYEEEGDTLGLAQIHDNIGSIYEDQAEASGIVKDDRYRQALKHFQIALVLSKAINNYSGAIVNLNNIGDIFRKQGDFEQAVNYTEESLQWAEKAHLDYQVKSACRDLSKTYLALGDTETAFVYLERSYELTDELFSSQIADEIARTESMFALEQKQQRIALLEKERTFNKTLLALSSGGGVVFVLLGALIFYQQRSKNSKKRKLLETEAELARAELVNAQLNERHLKAELENKMLREEQLNRELEIKSKSLTKSTLHMIQKNEFLSGLRKKIKSLKNEDDASINRKVKRLAKSIDFNFTLDGEWQEFETIFQQVHSDFFVELKQQYPDLTPSEVRLCAMIRLNLPSKEMAAIMGISQDSLRVARYRLRKRLGVRKGANLYSFINNIG